jgi:hypothetical protein
MKRTCNLSIAPASHFLAQHRTRAAQNAQLVNQRRVLVSFMLICMRKRPRPSAFTHSHSLARTHIGLEMHARLFLSSVYINIMNGHFIRHLRMQHHHAHMHSYDYYYHHQVTSDDPLAVSARASVLLYTPFIHSAASERLLLLPPASQRVCVWSARRRRRRRRRVKLIPTS